MESTSLVCGRLYKESRKQKKKIIPNMDIADSSSELSSVTSNPRKKILFSKHLLYLTVVLLDISREFDMLWLKIFKLLPN